MGLLDMFNGGGFKGLVGDLGQQGGLLSKFGMGKYGEQGTGVGEMQKGGFLDFLKNLGQQQGDTSQAPLGQRMEMPTRFGDNTTGPMPPTQLTGSLLQWLQQQKR